MAESEEDPVYKLPPASSTVEGARLDLQHRIWNLSLRDALYLSPLSPSHLRYALEIGSGSGLWAADFASQHPQCHVLAFDLQPGTPTTVPPNLKIATADAMNDEAWTSTLATSQGYDFIHGRMLMAGIKDWPKLIKTAYDALAPGGWIELQEAWFPPLCDDFAVTAKSSQMVAWAELLEKGMQTLGVDNSAAGQFSMWMSQIGFTEIEDKLHKWPCGGNWDDEGEELAELAKLNTPNFFRGCEGLSPGVFMRAFGWSQAQVDELVEQVKKEMTERPDKFYIRVKLCYARKPL